MNESQNAEVRIERLGPLRVASCTAFGPGPEEIAWAGLSAWMRARRIRVADSRFLGFNNPNPIPGSPNYGYEQWLVLPSGEAGPSSSEGPGLATKDFAGGLYAVLRHKGSPERLPASWAALRLWVERSTYSPASHQWLEEFLNPELREESEPRWDEAELDLYFPVAE